MMYFFFHYYYFLISFLILLLLPILPFHHALSQQAKNTLPPQHFRTKIASSIAKGERRARERSITEPRTVCPNCQRPPIQCVCDSLPSPQKIATNCQIIILQHPTEFRRRTFSTVPLIRLVLEDVSICVGQFDAKSHGVLTKLFSSKNDQEPQKKPMILFPGPDAWTLDDPELLQQQQQQDAAASVLLLSDDDDDDDESNNNKQQQKQTLILIDGTWTQAARMAKNSPFLFEECQQVQFTSTNGPTSLYDAIRKEPEPHCMSTLEACAKTLTLLDSQKGPEASKYLHAVLQTLVRQQLLHTSQEPRFNNRMGKKKMGNPEREKRIQEIERTLFLNHTTTTTTSTVMEQEHNNKNQTNSYRSSQFNILAKEEKRQRILEIEREKFFDERRHKTNEEEEGRWMNHNTNSSTHHHFENIQLRELRPSDARFIDSRWPYQSKKSYKMILRCLQAEATEQVRFFQHDNDDDDFSSTKTTTTAASLSCCLGITINNTDNDDNNNTSSSSSSLCAFIMRYETNGALGMLHVEEQYRRRGYASLLLSTATQILQERAKNQDDDEEQECILSAYILDGNTASEQLFSSQGWSRVVDPTVLPKKRKSGRRRAKRKWMKTIQPKDDA